MNEHEQILQLSAYLDGELDDAERSALEAHLPGCAECRATLDALRLTVADLGALPEPAPGEQDSWALRAAIARARGRPGRIGRAAAAVGSAAAVLIGFVVFTSGGGVPVSMDAAERGADAALTGGPSIEFLDTDFDDERARGLLVADVTPAMLEAIEDEPVRDQAAPARDQAAPARVAAPEQWVTMIRACEATILASATKPYRAERYLVAPYEGVQALFLVYLVGSPAEHRELWVVDPADCANVRFWAQEAA